MKNGVLRRTSGALVSNYSFKQQQKNYAVLLNLLQLVGALKKLRKATTVFVTPACQSVRPSVIICPSVRNKWAPIGRNFMKFVI